MSLRLRTGVAITVFVRVVVVVQEEVAVLLAVGDGFGGVDWLCVSYESEEGKWG